MLKHFSNEFRLFDGENVTCDDHHMWLCPFSRKEKIRIMISLSVSKRLHGLRIWNYNKSSDDTYRGVNFKLITKKKICRD
jgi:hypothetical protein